MIFKNVLFGLCAFSLLSPLQATKIYTSHSSSASRTEIVAIVQTEAGLQPVVYSWQPLGVIGTMMVMPSVAKINSSIPSILIGQEISELSHQSNALYIAGKDIQPPKLEQNQGWFKTHLLGWIYAPKYPKIYSPVHGWMHCHEDETGNISLYFYSTNHWKTANDRDYQLSGSPFQAPSYSIFIPIP